MAKLFLAVTLLVSSASGFTAPPVRRSVDVVLPSSSSSSRLFGVGLSSNTDHTTADSQQFIDDDDDDDDDEGCPIPTSPAAVFGKPLNKATKDRNRQLVHATKTLLFDGLFGGANTIDRAFARFYALETIARMPYFSYLSVLHLLETLGLWRRADYLKVHFAESWNELHHLLIMEELGGNHQWRDRFVAQHVAVFYYWIVVALYMFNPTLAYNLNQAVEEEAYETYDTFLVNHGDFLKGQPAPKVAVQYYAGEDLYMFDAMHMVGKETFDKPPTRLRRPVCDTLYDCFVNVRDDELEHVKTMAHLQEDGDFDECVE